MVVWRIEELLWFAYSQGNRLFTVCKLCPILTCAALCGLRLAPRIRILQCCPSSGEMLTGGTSWRSPRKRYPVEVLQGPWTIMVLHMTSFIPDDHENSALGPHSECQFNLAYYFRSRIPNSNFSPDQFSWKLNGGTVAIRKGLMIAELHCMSTLFSKALWHQIKNSGCLRNLVIYVVWRSIA